MWVGGGIFRVYQFNCKELKLQIALGEKRNNNSSNNNENYFTFGESKD